jgi:hypothetical protein
MDDDDDDDSYGLFATYRNHFIDLKSRLAPASPL